MFNRGYVIFRLYEYFLLTQQLGYGFSGYDNSEKHHTSKWHHSKGKFDPYTYYTNTNQPGLINLLQQEANFYWSSTQKGNIISSFAYGRLLGPIGALLAGRFGGGTIYSIGILATSLITLLSPTLVYISLDLFFIINVIFGAFEVRFR